MVVNTGVPASGAGHGRAQAPSQREAQGETPAEAQGDTPEEAQGETSAGGGPVSGTRRQMMRGLLAPALAVTLVPLVAASRPSRAEATAGGTGPGRPEPRTAERTGQAEGAAFDETYRGRRLRGVRSATGRAVGADTWHVTVDGRPLHLMRRADGSWLSMVDHYRSYPTPLAAARGAVDELGPGEHLRDTPASAGHDHHTGGRHGVHA
ncbi:tyrosinase cofactor [Streptomyces mayonensis]|uniref:tyrosinase cofactor n=1 Tax=Streptomyces mayonensis TaxID=2750816 RepID=UPI001C1DE0A8|nr:tyrosinase cofactor [Streptomyces sp. A108]MBU6531129.1 tyrosinase [Streptomyces sp. A108]